MGFNYVTIDTDQGFLLPPDLREWLEPDHLVYFVLDAVAQFDLSPFDAAYRVDGRGGAAYEPRLMVGLLLFAYCEGVRSSRKIERLCARDVAYRVMSGNRRPDHSTISRFRDRHAAALRGLFVDVLRLCAEAGLMRVGVVAVDGTKLRAYASSFQNYDADRADRAIARLEKQVAEMMAEAARVDAAETAADTARRDDDDPPAPLRDRQRRLAALRAAKDRLDTAAAAAQRVQDERVAAWEQNPKGVRPAAVPPKDRRGLTKTNVTDPDSRIMMSRHGYLQAFNAQAVATTDQVIIGAAITPSNEDYHAFHPMLEETRAVLDAAGITDRLRCVVADAGYSTRANREHPTPLGDQPLALVAVPPLGGKKPGTTTERPDPRFRKDPSLARMAARLQNPAGRALYARRKTMIEPVFGQNKQLGGPGIHRRGFTDVGTEWKLITIAHNLLKCWRHGFAELATT